MAEQYTQEWSPRAQKEFRHPLAAEGQPPHLPSCLWKSVLLHRGSQSQNWGYVLLFTRTKICLGAITEVYVCSQRRKAIRPKILWLQTKIKCVCGSPTWDTSFKLGLLHDAYREWESNFADKPEIRWLPVSAVHFTIYKYSIKPFKVLHISHAGFMQRSQV